MQMKSAAEMLRFLCAWELSWESGVRRSLKSEVRSWDPEFGTRRTPHQSALLTHSPQGEGLWLRYHKAPSGRELREAVREHAWWGEYDFLRRAHIMGRSQMAPPVQGGGGSFDSSPYTPCRTPTPIKATMACGPWTQGMGCVLQGFLLNT